MTDDRPTILLVHGWPDRSTVWSAVAERLADRYHVVAPDQRGVGDGPPAEGPGSFRIERLAEDLDAAARAASPDRPVHLVGHDWGSIVGWEYVADPDRRPHVASFTSISGPCLDHAAHAIKGNPRLAARQAVRSIYTVPLQLPGLRTLPWHLGMDRVFGRVLRRIEGVDAAPTLAEDARGLVPIYRENLGRRTARPQERRTDLPVLLVVNRRDPAVDPRLLDGVERWAPNLTRHELDAGHWSIRSHPDAVASLIADHVEAHAPTS